MPRSYVEFAIVGGLREDYCITTAGEILPRMMGGNALYAAVGARVWSEHIGVVARVGENYPTEWLSTIEMRRIDIHGVKIIPGPQDTRTFYAYRTPEERDDLHPAQHFARLGQPLPEALRDYNTSTNGQDSRTKFGPLAVRPSEVIQSYFHARGFHLAPFDFMVHNTLPAYLRRHGIRCVTLDPSVRYMTPEYAEDVRQIISGLDAFLPSEMEVRSFFGNHVTDGWEAAEAFGAMGAKVVVVKLGARGQYVYETASRRKWHVPAYPAKVVDVTGAGDAYCGGFLVGLAQTSDPLEAALHGTVSASLVLEGAGALYALDSTPGLAAARLEAVRNAVRVQ